MLTYLKEDKAIKTPVLTGIKFSIQVAIMPAAFCSGILKLGTRGGVVVKALRYKPAGRGFDSRWCHWNFSVT